ncbi:CASP-like protein 4D1 [Gossypium australe]|uniref:CASP-like protein n=1 Tax=Gossypium australe TaxID=47621 RepID=A0A5B6WRZ2_9ROSI|nr:CASP-like protein 4D1 [Gossypium australe]
MASKKGMAIARVVLRLFTILFAAGCIVVLTLDKAPNGGDSNVTFRDVIGYKYVFATAAVAAAYCLLLLPFTMYRACTGKKLVRGPFLPTLYFYGDKVVAFVLASGVGAGFLDTADLKVAYGDFLELFGEDFKDTPLEGFFNKGYVATALLAGAFLCMAILSIFSFPCRPPTDATNKGFFFR